MFIKRSFKISLLGMALFMLLVLAGHNVGQLANLTFFTLASDGPFISPLTTHASARLWVPGTYCAATHRRA